MGTAFNILGDLMRNLKMKITGMIGLLFLVSSSFATLPPFDLCDADLDGDGFVSITDIVLFAEDFFSGNHPARSDFNDDGAVDLTDVILLATALGKTGC